MTEALVGVLREALLLALVLAAPALAGALIAGVVTGVIGAVTQIQDPAVQLVPRVAGVAIALAIASPLIAHQAAAFGTHVFSLIAGVGGELMLVVAVLVALRLVPAALTLPVLGGPLAPWSARLALTAMAAAALALVQPPEVVTAVSGLPLAGLVAIAVKELAIGAVLALIVAVPFLAADTAGRWIGASAGGLGAGGIGPTGPTSTTGLVTSLLAVVVFVGIGGHLVVISALAGSYDALPLLGGVDRAVAAQHAGAAATAMLGASVALAAPALVASALVELALGLIQRAGGGALPVSGGALRAASMIAFFAASLLLLSIALARGLGDAARAMEAAIPVLGG